MSGQVSRDELAIISQMSGQVSRGSACEYQADGKDNVPVKVTTSMQELVERASYQNFVPVVDDKNAFIGIVTRRAIIKYCQQSLFSDK